MIGMYLQVFVSGTEAGLCKVCKEAVVRINAVADADPHELIRAALSNECNNLPRFFFIRAAVSVI